MNRILLSSFWIDRFGLILHLEREVVNSKRGLEQERVKTFRYPFFQNLFKILPSSSFIVEARNDFQLFQIHFRSPPSLFPDPIVDASRLSIDIQHFGNRSSMKFSLSLPSKREKYRG